MKNKLQNKDKGLGFLRHWKVMTMTLLLLTFSIGQMWGADPTSTYDVSDLIAAGTITTSTINDDLDQTISNVTYDWTKGSSSNNVKISSSRVQLFGDGQSLTISTSSDYRIKSIRFAVGNKSNSPTAIKESADAGTWDPAFTSSAFNTGNYTFTVTTPTAGGSYTFTIFKSGGTNQRADFDDIVVTYDAAPADHPTVVYYPNGATSGTVPVDANSPYTSGDDVIVLGNSGNLEKTNKEFAGWNTNEDGTGVTYAAGDKISNVTTNIKLYAKWVKPATGSCTISYTLTKGKADVSGEASVTTISGLSTAFAKSNLNIGSDNSQEGYCGQITGHGTSEHKDASKYVSLAFTIADGYTFSPSAVGVTVKSNYNKMYSQVEISDGTTSVLSEEFGGSTSDATASFAASAFNNVKFAGTVTVKVYQWMTVSGSSKRAYIKSPVTITGTVATAVAPSTYDATFANGGHGTAPAKAEGVTSVTLTEITGVAGWKNIGWKADVATKNGSTSVPANTLIANDETITLLENTTFTAEWAQLYTVTYNKAAEEGGDVPTQDPLVDGSTFKVKGSGSLWPPTPGQVFRGWDDGKAAEPYKEGDDYTIDGANVNFTAVWGATTSYTITLDAKGGSVASYDSWTKVDDVYSKTVVEGTTVPLLAFTKAGLQLMFFRDGSANEYSGSVTLNSDMNLSAVWGEEKEVELYYWEGKSGGAIERGGTAVTVDNTGTAKEGNADVNAAVSTYYTIRVQGKADYSKDYIKITTDEPVKTGDKITFTGFISKNSEQDAALLMKAGDKVLFAETTTLPNIAYPAETPGTPEEREYTISTTNVDATVLDLMRNSGYAGTNCFVTKIAITGTRVVEVKDPCETPSITGQPTGASYTWKETVAALTVTATVSDGGTLHYQWYKEAGETDTKVGTDAASYTPTESGTYYVVVTNKKTGFADASATSNNAVVTIGTRPSYTVTYYDGTTSLGSESVLEDASPAEYAAKQAKAVYGVTGLYEFNGWYNNSDLAEAHKIANIAALSITANTPIYGKWTRIEAQDVDLVEYAATIAGDASTEEEFNAFKTWFTGKGYAYANLKELDNKAGNNGAYLGLKTKSDAAYIAFNVPANKRVTIKLGYMAGAAEMYINGVKDETQALTGGSTGSGDNYADWHYDVTEASTLKLQMKTGNTCVVKAITIGEIPAQSDDATLSDLKVDGVTVAGFNPSTFIYYMEVPYGTAVEDLPKITAVTCNEEHATATATPVAPTWNDTYKCYLAQVVVTPQDGIDGHKKYYHLRVTIGPKYGVCLIKGNITDNAIARDASSYLKAEDVTLQNSGVNGNDPGATGSKFQGGSYIKIELPEGETFKAGDMLALNVTRVTADKLRVFKSSDNTSANVIGEGAANMTVGVNTVTLTEDARTLYLKRGSDASHYKDWNPHVTYVAVYRLMAPFIESFEVAGVAATISGTAISAEVPAVTDITALTPTVKFWANGGGTIDKTGVQNFTDPVTYTVSSSYAEDATGAYAPVTYTVTVTKAAAIKEVQISGTLSVQEGLTTTLTATVIDTYDAPAAIQDVTWTSDATSVATVDNGVVTGKTVGTAHITATSVADGTKYATVEVTVAENLCREWNTPDNISDATISVGKIRMTHPSCGSSSKSPYSGASNVDMLKIEAQKGSSSKYFDIYFSDGALFESLELGLTAGSSDALNYAIAFCSASTFSEDKIISVEEYPANPNNVAQALNNIVLPDGTKSVRLYKSFQVDPETTKGSGSSIYIYHVAACKKEIVAVSGVTLNKSALSLPRRSSETLVATVAPNNATDKSLIWESDDETVATVDANGLVKAVGEGTANITATSVADGTKSATCEVTVTAFDCAGFTGNLFTLEVTTTSSQTYNIGNGTEVELLAAHVDVEGGHAYAGRDGSTKGDVSGYITASSNVACIRLQKANSMQGYLKVVMDDCTLRNSDVISFTQRAGEERSISITRTAEFSNAITTGDAYTVTQGDGLAGTNTFYIWYDGSQRVDVKTLTVTRVALVDITSVSLADMTVRTTKSRAPQLTTDPVDGTILSVTYEIIGSTPASTIDSNTGVVTAGDDEEVFTVQVTVNGDKVATCEVTVVANLTQLDVEESTVWDFSRAGIAESSFTNEVLANVDGVTLDASQFNARQLVGSANNIAATYFQGTMLSFNATEPGLLSVRFTSGNNNARVLKVYDKDENLLATWNYSGAATENESVEVPAGKVTLRSFQGESANNVRIMRMEFLALENRRTAGWIKPGELGTVCLENTSIVKGATIYELQGPDQYGKLVFDEVQSGEVVAGIPYLFEATATGQISFYKKVNAAHADEAGELNGMHGTFSGETFSPSDGNAANLYYFSGNAIWCVANRSTDANIPAHGCYLNMEEFRELPIPSPTPAPGRRRITLGVNGKNTPTGLENGELINGENGVQKVLINGELFILRGEKMYDATGRLVK